MHYFHERERLRPFEDVACAWVCDVEEGVAGLCGGGHVAAGGELGLDVDVGEGEAEQDSEPED